MERRPYFQSPCKIRAKKFLTTPLMRRSLAYRAMLKRGWSEVGESDDWDIFWADVYAVGQDSGFVMSSLKSHQLVNHFPRHTELTRKDALVKNVKRARRTLERENKDSSAFHFLPQTYHLPQEYSMFAEEFRKSPGQVWIMKPCGRSQGEGIFLIDKLRQVFLWRKAQESKEQAEPYIISRYVDRPFLIGGRKFDLRLYVLVTCFAPLQVHLYRAGFCRFSCGMYNAQNLDNLTLHLTNIAIQRKQNEYDRSTGMKWALNDLRKYLLASIGQRKTDSVFDNIEQSYAYSYHAAMKRCIRTESVVIHSLLAVQQVVTADNHCFELFGYDILLDAELKPWLLEVNASPSLSADTAMDLALKSRMLDDCLTVMDPDCTVPRPESGFDLIYGFGPNVNQKEIKSRLGCCLPAK